MLVLVVLVVVVLPPRFTAHHPFDTASEELKAQNDVRTTLLQALASAVLLGAYFTWRQLGVIREGQIADRYTKAVDQLGSEHLDVRVGGSYTLERIARDSERSGHHRGGPDRLRARPFAVAAPPSTLRHPPMPISQPLSSGHNRW